jgi:hypothetical protein
MYLSINEKPNMSQLYSFIFHYLEESKLKIFRWKLLQYIIPTKKLFIKWRIAINSQCNFCGQDEDYLHYFVSCPYLKEFWVEIQQILKKSNIENSVTLKHIVFGYKIFDKDYLRYIPDFYKEILQTWIKMGGGQTKMLSHFAEIRKQLIWGNKFIMFKNKSLMFDNWINSDLIYI